MLPAASFPSVSFSHSLDSADPYLRVGSTVPFEVGDQANLVALGLVVGLCGDPSVIALVWGTLVIGMVISGHVDVVVAIAIFGIVVAVVVVLLICVVSNGRLRSRSGAGLVFLLSVRSSGGYKGGVGILTGILEFLSDELVDLLSVVPLEAT